MALPLPTGIQLTTLDPQFREDPYPVLSDLRSRNPVHHDTQLGRFVITRHDDAQAVLRDPGYWSDPRKGNEGGFARGYLMRSEEEPPMLMMDNPGHRRLRNLVSAPFTPKSVESWRGLARDVARRTVSNALQDHEGEFDLIGAVASIVPVVVVAEMLGISSEHHAKLKRWSDAVIEVAFSPVADPEGAAAAVDARDHLNNLFRNEISRRRASPGNDVISEMVRTEAAGEKLSDEEIAQQCELLLLAGNRTTSDLIGNAVMALLRNPGELAKLRNRPSLLTNAVEEVMRYDSSVTDTGRIANRDIAIGGVEIRQGDSITVFVAAANRDPDVYPNPDVFDIERSDTHHHSFGGGRHFCLGAHLARLEVGETLSALISYFSSMSFGGVPYRYAANPSFRGLEELWIKAQR